MYLHSGNLTGGHGLSFSQPSSGGSYHVSEEDEYLLHRIGGGGSSHVIESKRLHSSSPPGRLSGSPAGIHTTTTGAIAAQPRSAAGQSSHALSGSAPTSSGSVGALSFTSQHQRQQHLQLYTHPQQLHQYLNVQHHHHLASHSTPSLQLCDRGSFDGGPQTDLQYQQQNINQNLEPPMDPLTRFLSLHPQYQDPFNRLHSFLLHGDGPLSYTVRHYIGLMAAARHHCKYLVNEQKEEFRAAGGDPNWLLGLDHAPQKIQNLNEINKILAHQPWLLTKEHIEKLTKGEDNWSLSELVQAIVLLAHFHSISSFVFGCGFNDLNELNSQNVGSNSPPANSNNLADLLTAPSTLNSAPPSPPSAGQHSPPLSNSLTIGSQSSSNSLPSVSNIATVNTTSTTASTTASNTLDVLMWKMRSITEQKQQNFEFANQEELVKNQSLEIDLATAVTARNNAVSSSIETIPGPASTPLLTSALVSLPSSSSAATVVATTGLASPHIPASTGSPLGCPAMPGNSCSVLDVTSETDAELERFVQDRKFVYVDFARQRALADITTFRVQDYSWSDHAYSLLNRFYPDVGGLLDEKFRVTYNLTYYTMGRKTNVDTTVFRRAIWNYIQCMYGIRHDDYDYHEVNELLERNLKTYIKTVCFFPHQTRRRDCDLVMREFRRSEKIHVNMMIAEARLQAELLYALRTVMRYMT